MTWRGILTIVLLIAAGLSGWAVWKQSDQRGPASTPAARSDYVLNDFQIITLDSQGKEAFTLRAPRLDRNPNDKTMTLVTPLFLFPVEGGPVEGGPDQKGEYWETRSQTGWVSAEADEVRLRGEVNVLGPAPDRVRMLTEQLNVFPEDKRATSPVLVTVTQPGSTMRGLGMQVDMTSKRYALLSQVQTRYDPSQR
ncbi:MAG: LPS export ABC transporter periplasmic protein LptC [Pseudomonadota bacterium]|nr:LPS export ABC transporter periplasmic protein LptC [Pseudomonadota bacterium]